MFSKTVDSKPLIKLESGETIHDLTVSVFNKDDKIPPTSYDVYKAPLSSSCRPDLIAIMYYRDEGMTEGVLKFNGISNPFRMMPGSMVVLPKKEDMERLMISNGVSSYGDENGKFDNDPQTTVNNGAKRIKQKIRDSYKYINPNNIKEILASEDRNKSFDSLVIPKGNTASYISTTDNPPVYKDENNGRFYIPGDLGNGVQGGDDNIPPNNAGYTNGVNRPNSPTSPSIPDNTVGNNNNQGNTNMGNINPGTSDLSDTPKTVNDIINEYKDKAEENGCIDTDGETPSSLSMGTQRF